MQGRSMLRPYKDGVPVVSKVVIEIMVAAFSAYGGLA
jgi:hypothetical protein